MKQTIFTIIVLLSMYSISKAEEKQDPTKWTVTDTLMQVAFSGLLEMDRQQSQYIASHRYRITSGAYQSSNGVVVWSSRSEVNREANPIIGVEAHQDRINAYFAVSAISHAAVSYILPYAVKACGGSDSLAKYSRTLWQSAWIAAETNTVIRNYSMGVKMTF